MTAAEVFLTGFPGFLGASLLERLVARTDVVHCLVQPKYRAAAEARAADLSDGDWQEEVRLYDGDITEPGLGLDDEEAQTLHDAVGEVFHLAAVYDLGVSRDVAEAVNVDGTEHVLDFAAASDVDRFQYVSTCYVSGRYDGVFSEDDLDVGQCFNNHYEATKFEAECLVQERMDDGFPAIIYRPAIVVGDSRTGQTEKYDGPYYVLRWMQRCPGIAPLPRFLGAGSTELNLVPREFVVDAIDYLSQHGDPGAVYQLCDPNPPTIPELTALFAAATETRVLPVPSTTGIATRLLGTEVVRGVTGIPPETLDYFTLPTRYVNPNTRRALAGSDISCPPFASYVDVLVAYTESHDARSDAMT